MQEFICFFIPDNRYNRKETWNAETNQNGRWRKYDDKETISGDKTSLDIFCLKDKSLSDLNNLPDPEDLAAEIINNIDAGLNSFRQIAVSLGEEGVSWL